MLVSRRQALKVRYLPVVSWLHARQLSASPQGISLLNLIASPERRALL